MGLGSIGKAIGGALGGLNWISVGTSAMDSIGNIIGQNSANAKNKRQWQRERSWEEQKMKNAHQWEAEDLKAAGLNPTLTAGGSGAVGSGSPHAEMGAGSFGNFGQEMVSNFSTITKLMQDQEAIDARSQLDRATARKTDVETGLKPKEVAIKEAESDTHRMEAQTRRQEANSRIQEIMALLPGQTIQQKQEIMQKSIQLGVDAMRAKSEKKEEQANQKILELTGGFVSLNDIKAIIAGLTGASTYITQKQKDRKSNEKIAKERNRNHRTRTFNSKGKLQGETYYEYAD